MAFYDDLVTARSGTLGYAIHQSVLDDHRGCWCRACAGRHGVVLETAADHSLTVLAGMGGDALVAADDPPRRAS